MHRMTRVIIAIANFRDQKHVLVQLESDYLLFDQSTIKEEDVS